MWDVISDILTSDGGAFAFVLAFILGAFWLVHWVTVRIIGINEQHGAFAQTVDKIEGHIDDIRRDTAYLKGTIDTLKNNPHASSPVQAHSPLGPSEVGLQIIEELGLRDMIVRNADRIVDYLDRHMGSRNPYDIQQFCIETASVEPERMLSADDVDRIKQYAFNHGQTVFYYGSLIGVLARDLYFKRHQMSIADVDEHDPAKK